MSLTTLIDSRLRDSWVVSNPRLHPSMSGPHAAIGEFAVALTVFELEQKCSEALRAGAAMPTGDLIGTPLERLLGRCAEVLGADTELATESLGLFYRVDNLASRRIVIDPARLARTVDALEAAARDDNRAAYETLLRRGLRQLTAPLLSTT